MWNHFMDFKKKMLRCVIYVAFRKCHWDTDDESFDIACCLTALESCVLSTKSQQNWKPTLSHHWGRHSHHVHHSGASREYNVLQHTGILPGHTPHHSLDQQKYSSLKSHTYCAEKLSSRFGRIWKHRRQDPTSATLDKSVPCVIHLLTWSVLQR